MYIAKFVIRSHYRFISNYANTRMSALMRRDNIVICCVSNRDSLSRAFVWSLPSHSEKKSIQFS